MIRKIIKYTVFVCVLLLLAQAQDLFSRDLSFSLIDIQKLTRYDEDRIAFQQFEKPFDTYKGDEQDNSIALLMIIRDKKIYLFKDGYDNAEQVRLNKISYDRGNQFLPDLWQNKIDGNPDFVLLTDRRIELQKNTTQEWVSNNYKDFYINVRDKFLKKQVSIFLSLIINRKDSGVCVTRTLLQRRLAEKETSKYAITVTARSTDGATVYYAEDADGDGITETFTVNCNDGFVWGYNSGPNLVFIKNNTQKDIEKFIGRITNLAYYGSPEEEQIIKKSFPTTEKITNTIDSIYFIDSDTDKYLKRNNINIEDSVEKGSKGDGTKTK